MKKQQFINRGEDIFQYGGWWCSAKGEHCADVIATAMNELIEENEKLKLRLKEERELVMKINRKCDALTIKKQELELEIIRLEKIIRTGDGDDCNRTS